VVEDRDSVSEGEDDTHAVLHEDHRHIAWKLCESLDEGGNLVDGQAGGWLVKQQQARSQSEACGQLDPSLIPMWEMTDFDIADVQQSPFLEHTLGFALDSAIAVHLPSEAEQAVASSEERDQDVLACSQLLEDCRLLVRFEQSDIDPTMRW
jgi:hypothetical protein